MGIQLVRRDDGEAELALDLLPHHLNLRGVAHGGVVSYMLDAALGMAVISAIPREWWCATTALNVQFLQGPTAGRLTARGRIVRRGDRVAFAAGEVLGDDGRVLASATGTWHLWPYRPGKAQPPAGGFAVLEDGTRVPVGKILAVGRNYAEHAVEMGASPERPPVLFLKPATAIVHDGATIPLPVNLGAVHHEVELVVAIGTSGSRIARERALEHVLGYAVGIDLTLRDLQGEAKKRGEPWSLAKGFDGSAPLSTVTAQERVGDGGQYFVHGPLRGGADRARVAVDAAGARRSDLHRYAGGGRPRGTRRPAGGPHRRCRHVDRRFHGGADVSGNFTGSTVLITGASAGIGAATVAAFLAEGAKVIAVARSADKLAALAADQGDAIRTYTADVADAASMTAMTTTVLAGGGPPDVIVANAGIGLDARFSEMGDDALHRVLEVNVVGVVRTIRPFVEPMCGRGRGRILFVSSIVGRRGTPHYSAYSASKFALDGLADALAAEIHGSGVTVGLVYPSSTRTEFQENLLREGPSQHRKRLTAHTPESVARAIVSMAGSRRRRRILGLEAKALAWANLIAPRRIDALLARMLNKKRNEG
jgi:uncharacterized protein (TIGR00369 family)